MKIYLVDEVMSSGKSHWMLNKMKEWNESNKFKQFVYLSPLLSEVGGVKCNQTNKYLSGRIQKQLPDMKFKYPIPVKGSKRSHSLELLHQGENISATHNLFLNLDKSCSDLIKEYDNVLVIDECLDAYQQFRGISKKSLALLIEQGIFSVDQDSLKLIYHREKDLFPDDGWEFGELIKLSEAGYIFYVNGELLVWEYPVSILSAFNEVWVLTYLFEGSFMSAWCKINNIEVVRVKPELHRSTEEVKAYIKDCIEVVVTPSLKNIENYSYSQTWWGNSAVESVVDKVRKSITSCVTITKAKTENILITCPKANWSNDKTDYDTDFVSEQGKIKKRPLIKGKGFSRADWLYSDARATNDYSHKSVLVYLIGKNPNTVLWNFCHSKGVDLDKELYAIASMVQWIFRGSVRKKEKMYLIMPSKEMRDLYFRWLETSDEELVK